jgi:hypothetical protein
MKIVWAEGRFACQKTNAERLKEANAEMLKWEGWEGWDARMSMAVPKCRLCRRRKGLLYRQGGAGVRTP